MANELVFPHDYVILDACCVINLCESGSMRDILVSLQAFVAVAEYVYQGEILPEAGLLKLQPIVDSGLLAVTLLESEDEMISFVNFAVSLDDGEAATSAIAVNRDWAIATDDLKAIRFLEQTISSIKIVSTLDLLKHWVDNTHPPASIIKTTLENIRTQAHYVPSVRHPLYKWWEIHIAG